MDHLLILPKHLNTITLFGITLLLGLIAGEIARRIRFLPKISAYIAMGFFLGPSVLNVMSPSVLAAANLFVDISLGIILFDLGRHLDFTWLREDRGLIYTSFAESGLSFSAAFLAAHFFLEFSWLTAALAASFMMATSPAVVLMIANDLNSEGPVTRRTLALTSLNNFFALTIFTFLLPMTLSKTMHLTWPWVHSIYLLLASLGVGVFMFFLTRVLGAVVGKQKIGQFVLFIGVLVCTIGVAQMFHLPIALTLFIFGVATRNLDAKHVLMELDFGFSAQLFFILLFVVTGTYLHFEGFRHVILAVIMFIVIRGLAKMLGIWFFSRESRLTKSQVFAISLALTPMAGLAISMSNVLNEFNPEFNAKIAVVIATMAGILEIVGPIATQFAFIESKETLSDEYQ